MSLSESVISTAIDRLFSVNDVKHKKHKKGIMVSVDINSEVSYKPKPTNPIMYFDSGAGHDDRVFSTSKGELLKDAEKIIGDKCEFAMVSGINVKWIMLSKVRGKDLRRVSCLGGGVVYQITYREFWLNGKSSLTTSFIGFKGGDAKICHYEGKPLPLDEKTMSSIHLVSSMIEDTKRLGSFKLEFKSGDKRFTIAADPSEIKSLLSDREDPKTITGRLKPIAHLVSKHKRKSGVSVESHKRGILTLSFAGYEVSVSEHGNSICFKGNE